MELFEKDTPPNNKKEVDETLAKRLERRASRRLISQNEDQKVNVLCPCASGIKRSTVSRAVTGELRLTIFRIVLAGAKERAENL